MKNYLAFDIGGTSVKFAVLKESGEIVKKGSFETPKESIEGLYDLIEKTVDSINLQLWGVALSCPGAVNSEKGTIGGVSAIPYIHGPNIKTDLQERLNMKVTMENDANCAALAEVWLGEAMENQDLVFIVMGSGVGGAIIKDRKLHKGKNLQAGEFGIMYYPKEDGSLGMWGEVSTVNFANRVSEKLKMNLNGKELFRLGTEEKHPQIVKEIEQWYLDIAKGLLIIQHVYDPEKIIFGGAISEREEMLGNIEKSLDKLIADSPLITMRPEVKRCKFNNDSNLIGAMYNFFIS